MAMISTEAKVASEWQT